MSSLPLYAAREKASTPRLLKLSDVANRLDVSRRTIWRWLALGRFPRPIRFSGVCVRWRSEDVEAFIEALMEQRYTVA